MKETAADSLETSRARITRREGLKLSAASLMASLLPIPALAETQSPASPKETKMADKTAIRPFHFEASKDDLTDLRRRITAAKWPDREQVSDSSQGVQLATMQKLAQLLGDRARLAQVRGEDQRGAELPHRDRWARHPLPSRSLQARQRAADDRHPRLAWLDHRADEDHRAADQPHRAWRDGGRCLSSRDPVSAGLRLLGQADEAGVESGQHRQGVGDAHAASRLHEVRRAGWRLGQRRLRGHGPATAAGTARHSHQHGGDGTARRLEGPVARWPAARRPLARRKARLGSAR